MTRAGIAGLTLSVLAALAPQAVPAQDRAATLADIRQELAALERQIEGLRAELTPTGESRGTGSTTGEVTGGPLARLDAIEGELRRLTDRTEELQFRIDRIVSDGTNRIDDLKFRLTELEGGAVSAIPPTEPLGWDGPRPSTPMPPPATSPELAMGEQADFDAAVTLTREGTPADAYEALNRFVDAYPRSPLAAEAHLYRGDMLATLGNTAQAGRAYLESFTLAETSDPGIASEALLKLGGALADLGQTREACITIEQVADVYPGTTAADRARERLAGLACE